MDIVRNSVVRAEPQFFQTINSLLKDFSEFKEVFDFVVLLSVFVDWFGWWLVVLSWNYS